MKRVMLTRFETSESKMLAIRGRMLNFSFMQKSTGCNSLPCSILDRPTAMRMPIIMLSTMFQFSWPKCTAKPFFGPNKRWRLRTRLLLASTFIDPRRDKVPLMSGSSGGVQLRSPRNVGTDLPPGPLARFASLCTFCFTTRSSQLDESREISLRVGVRAPASYRTPRVKLCSVVAKQSCGCACGPDSAEAHQLMSRSNSARTWSTCTEPRAP
mmetsp:Transcript_102234/g.286613  ORF Transcript_102234/g.286613 Transcript_102234/m.286613 type:complete len:212 (-) Transcript_102234:1031-1666(-)